MPYQPLIKRSRYSSSMTYNDRIAQDSCLRAERSKTCPRLSGTPRDRDGGRLARLRVRSAGRARDGPPASETVLGLVVPAQLTFALQPAEQHGVPVQLGGEVEQQGRDALQVKPFGREPAEDVTQPRFERLGLGQAAERRDSAPVERGLQLDQVRPHLHRVVGFRQEV